jgi:spore germination cell wall hydrolase CwlJ-like protein
MNEIDILSRTIYGEARGEYLKKDGGLAALIAVANVIMNRVKLKTWFGKSIIEVCKKPWQFSCWNSNDPNYPLLLKEEIDDSIFRICQQVAEGVAYKNWPDLTKGADHYHSIKIQSFPKWAQGSQLKIQIGNHLFYQLGR